MDQTTVTNAPQGPLDMVFDSFAEGWRRMVWILFTGPYASVANWLWWGLILLLAGVASGSGSSGDFPNGDSGSGVRDLRHGGIDHLSAGWIAAIVGLVCCVIVFALVMLYIRSRFRFILLDGVLTGEPRIRDVWPRTSEIGLQYFVWELILNLGLLLLFLPVILMWLPVLRSGIQGHEIGASDLAGRLVLTMMFVIPLVIIKAIIDWFVYDLVLPQAWLGSGGFLEALKLAFGKARENFLATIVFFVARLVVGVGGAIAGCCIVVGTCIVWIWPVALIVLLVVISIPFPPAFLITVPLSIVLGLGMVWLIITFMSPIYLFYRSWSLAFVGKLDPDLGRWSEEPPSPDAPPAGPPPIAPEPPPEPPPVVAEPGPEQQIVLPEAPNQEPPPEPPQEGRSEDDGSDPFRGPS